MVHIRQLNRYDWQALRAIRLKALQNHAEVYGSRYEDEAIKDDRYWQDMLDGHDCAVFGLYDDQCLIGIGGAFTDKHDESGQTAVLAMGYIETNYRGQKLSRLLYEARIGWAQAQHRFTKIVVSHRRGNEASRRANQAFGFSYSGTGLTHFIDGEDAEIKYEMELER